MSWLSETHAPGEVKLGLPLQMGSFKSESAGPISDGAILALCDEAGSATAAVVNQRLGLSVRAAQKRLKGVEDAVLLYQEMSSDFPARKVV